MKNPDEQSTHYEEHEGRETKTKTLVFHHEEHEEHEVIFYNFPSCPSRPSWLNFYLICGPQQKKRDRKNSASLYLRIANYM